jgi:putative flippase GtrA
MMLAWLLGALLNDPWLTTISAAVARIVSSLVNFFVNQELVFKSKLSTSTSLVRYIILAVCIFLSQLGITYGIYMLFGISETQIILRGIIYVAVMTVLFVVSFLVQQRWVFVNKSKAKQEV